MPGGGGGGGTTSDPPRIGTRIDAKASIFGSLERISDLCFSKLRLLRSTTQEKARDIFVFDGRPGEDGALSISKILGAGFAVRHNETFNSITYGKKAVILTYEDKTVSRYLVLGANFFTLETDNQRITLAHEVFHFVLNKDDFQLGSFAGYTGPNVVDASVAFQGWLEGGCRR